MATRRIPCPAEFYRLSVSDQWQILEFWLKDITEEIDGLRLGYIYISDGKGPPHYLRLARARLHRLTKLANLFGFWLEDAAKEESDAA